MHLIRQPPGMKSSVEDGSFAAIVPGGATIYASAQLGTVFRFQGNTFTNVSPAGGSNFLFITPFMLDPQNSDIMYLAAGDQLWRNSNLSGIPNFSNDPTNVGWSVLNNASDNGNTISAIGIPKQRSSEVVYFGETLDAFQQLNSITNLIRVNNPTTNGSGEDITPPGVTPGSWTSSIVFNEFDELGNDGYVRELRCP